VGHWSAQVRIQTVLWNVVRVFEHIDENQCAGVRGGDAIGFSGLPVSPPLLL